MEDRTFFGKSGALLPYSWFFSYVAELCLSGTLRCKEEVNWSEVRKEIVKILDDDKYKELFFLFVLISLFLFLILLCLLLFFLFLSLFLFSFFASIFPCLVLSAIFSKPFCTTWPTRPTTPTTHCRSDQPNQTNQTNQPFPLKETKPKPTKTNPTKPKNKSKPTKPNQTKKQIKTNKTKPNQKANQNQAAFSSQKNSTTLSSVGFLLRGRDSGAFVVALGLALRRDLLRTDQDRWVWGAQVLKAFF